MLQFDKIRKDELLKGEPREHHADGKFKPGEATQQKTRGDGAFQSAHAHLDDASKAAQSGDEDKANFHLNMAHQYAAIGVQNHIMGGFVKDPNAYKPAMNMPGQQQPQRGGGQKQQMR